MKREQGGEGMQISQFVESQTDAVIALWTRCGLVRSWNDPRLDIARKQTDKNGCFLVGHSADALIASVMVGYDGHRGSINYLSFDADFARHGYGALLMREAEDFLFSIGCLKINLCVRADNAAVIDFYNSVDYQFENVHLFGKRLIKDE